MLFRSQAKNSESINEDYYDVVNKKTGDISKAKKNPLVRKIEAETEKILVETCNKIENPGIDKAGNNVNVTLNYAEISNMCDKVAQFVSGEQDFNS